MKSIIVHGPQGCGKTLNAEALRVHYGMTTVLDGWTSRDRLPLRDTLVLTNESPAALGFNKLSVDVVSYADATCAMAVGA